MNRKTPRKKSATRRNSPARKVKRTSVIDRALRAMPISDKHVQNGLTIGLVGVFLLATFAVAHYSGFNAEVGERMAKAASDAGFEVDRVEVVGVDRIDQLKVYEVALSQKDRSMLSVDLDEVRDELLKNGWIKDARVSRRLPDTLVVDIVEREPVAIWQQEKKYSLVDESGWELENVARNAMPDLPVIAGNKANAQVGALMRLLDAAPALKPQVTGATWIGNRRWDLRFESGETLALPEGRDTAAAALTDFARMDGVNRLLGRGIVHFDLRDSERAYLRMPKKETGDAEPIS